MYIGIRCTSNENEFERELGNKPSSPETCKKSAKWGFYDWIPISLEVYGSYFF